MAKRVSYDHPDAYRTIRTPEGAKRVFSGEGGPGLRIVEQILVLPKEVLQAESEGWEKLWSSPQASGALALAGIFS